MSWQSEAVCQNENPDIFHPEKKDGTPNYKDEEGNPTKEVLLAREICGRCPVKLECLEFVLLLEAKPSHAGRYGIWAGSLPEQRAALVERKKLFEMQDQ